MNNLILYTGLLFIGVLPLQNESEKNKIIISSMYCEGCVIDAFNDIRNHNLDKRFDIILDTNFIEKSKINYKDINIKHTPVDEIFKKYQRFGNIMVIDEKGVKTILLTDQSLKDYIQF